MNKEIYLESGDKKYKCCAVLTDSLNYMLLVEEKADGLHLLMEARNGRCVTEKNPSHLFKCFAKALEDKRKEKNKQ